MITSLLQSPTVWKFVARHLLTAAGAYFVKKGIVDAQGWEAVVGAGAVAVSFVHSAWDKRDAIKQDIENLIKK